MMKKMFVLNAGFSIRMGWKAVDLILSESSRKKIKISDKAVPKELHAMIALDQLEERFGGTQPNMTENFWAINP